MQDAMKPEPLRSNTLEIQGIRHGFFTRHGGVSDGIYGSLNVGLGSSDSRDNVLENRRRVAIAMGVSPENLCTVYQCHTPDVITLDTPIDGQDINADAMVTTTPGLALGILTADCGPVLFADRETRVIGAAHAGWKGAFCGVLENTIEAMERLGARRENIVAVLGPSISQDNYEVGPEFVERLTLENTANASYLRPSGRQGHALFDLNGYTVDRLEQTGVTATCLGRCTYAEEDLFFSYRRRTHRKEPDYGRQISAIVLGDA